MLSSASLYEAVAIIKSDYYPFGMQMPGRNTNLSTYRYGYNGMGMDNETKGNGSSYTTEFRQYDPRLGRWLSTDPMAGSAPGWSPYRAFFDNPIVFSDPSGLFEKRGDARDYKKEHGIKGRITKNRDGSFDLVDKKNLTTYSKGNDSENYGEKYKNDGVEEGTLISANKTNISEKAAYSLWGSYSIRMHFELERQGAIWEYPEARNFKQAEILGEGKVMSFYVTYKEKLYRFNPGGTIDEENKHQTPTNFVYWYHNQDKFKDENGNVLSFGDIFLSKDEEWEAVQTKMLLELFGGLGADGDNPTGASPDYSSFIAPKYAKYGNMFPMQKKTKEENIKIEVAKGLRIVQQQCGSGCLDMEEQQDIKDADNIIERFKYQEE